MASSLQAGIGEDTTVASNKYKLLKEELQEIKEAAAASKVAAEVQPHNEEEKPATTAALSPDDHYPDDSTMQKAGVPHANSEFTRATEEVSDSSNETSPQETTENV